MDSSKKGNYSLSEIVDKIILDDALKVLGKLPWEYLGISSNGHDLKNILQQSPQMGFHNNLCINGLVSNGGHIPPCKNCTHYCCNLACPWGNYIYPRGSYLWTKVAKFQLEVFWVS